MNRRVVLVLLSLADEFLSVRCVYRERILRPMHLTFSVELVTSSCCVESERILLLRASFQEKSKHSNMHVNRCQSASRYSQPWCSLGRYTMHSGRCVVHTNEAMCCSQQQPLASMSDGTNEVWRYDWLLKLLIEHTAQHRSSEDALQQTDRTSQPTR